jgi:NSS family neurotransmitter:Na+ symporter
MSATPPSERGQWSGKLGFILAAAGSAIGLGNIWRFPFSAAEGGGGIFVLIYLFFVVAIGVPVMLAELSIGRKTELNPVGAFKKLAPKSWWPAVGGLGIATGFAILAFYSVVAGWTVGYLYKAVTGDFASAISGEQSGAMFSELTADAATAIFLTAIFMLLTILVVRGGISNGIERATKILMPLLFILLILMAARAVTLPGGWEGVVFLFQPDFSELSAGVVLDALGQALFSLSLGMGAMITYGSYFPKEENLTAAGASVALFDTLIAVLAGLIIFPALFYADVELTTGPGLVFVTLPTIFNTLPAAGQLFAISFYTLLAIAALTSTISLLEVVSAYFIDERNWSREKAVWTVGGICFVLAIPSALANGASGFFTAFLGEGLDFLTVQNNIWGVYSLSLGAFLICVFVGWKWGIPAALESLEADGAHPVPGRQMWGFLVKYICPIAVIVAFLYAVWPS